MSVTMTPKQKKAAEFYAKATPRQARKRALRKFRVKNVDFRKLTGAKT
jgi:hypothetical protein